MDAPLVVEAIACQKNNEELGPFTRSLFSLKEGLQIRQPNSHPGFPCASDLRERNIDDESLSWDYMG